jgi:hypothetical protein
MADNHFPLRDRSQERWPRRDSGAEIQYVLRAEEQILHSISAGTIRAIALIHANYLSRLAGTIFQLPRRGHGV